MNWFDAVALLVLLCVPAVSADAQGVALKYRWNKGESRTYRVTSQTDSEITGMPGGQPMTTAQTMTQVVKIVAEDVAPDGSATIRQTFQSIRMEGNGPMGKVVFDSASLDEGGDPMVQSMRRLLGAMVGESVLIEVAADGEVRRVQGASRIADKITRLIADDPAAGPAAQALKSALSDDALTKGFQQSFPRLPADPVKPGDTWHADLALGNQAIGRVAGRTTFTLAGINGEGPAAVARIAASLSLKQDVIPPPSGPGGTVMTLGEAKGEGEVLFDVAWGRIRRGTMRTHLPSTVTGTGPDGTPMRMQNTTTTTMTMELVEK